MEFVIVAKTQFFEQKSSGSSNYPNQQRTHAMREAVLTSARAKRINTSGYEKSDLVEIEFFWKNTQLQVDAVSRPGTVALFHKKRSIAWKLEDLWKIPFFSTMRRTKR